MAELEHRPEGENLDPAANLLGQKREMPDQMTTTPLMDQVLGAKDKGPEWTPEKVDQVAQNVEEMGKPLGWQSLEATPEQKAEMDRKFEDLMAVMPGESKTEKLQNLLGMIGNLNKLEKELSNDEGLNQETDASSQEQAA